MSRFIEGFESFAKENGLNVIRAVEVCRGKVSTVELQPANRSQDCYSVAKAFVVTAVGLVYDRGLLGLDERIADILAEELDGVNPELAHMTVHDALKHKIGLECGYLDIDVYSPEVYGIDFLQNVMNAEAKYKVGEDFSYTDAAFYLLSRVVEKKSGMPIETLMWQELFYPMDFAEVAWSKCPRGHAMGATGLYISCRDMAKLGELYLGKGEYGGRRYLSEEWVSTVLSRGYELTSHGTDGNAYGKGGNAYGKGGMYGQMLLVIPECERVVAWHSFEKKSMSALVEWVCRQGL